MSKLLDALKRAEQLRKEKLAQENVSSTVASDAASNPELEAEKQAELGVIQANREAEAAERQKTAELRSREADELALAKLAADRIAAEEAATAATADRMRAQAALEVAAADRAVAEAEAAKAAVARNRLEQELNTLLAKADAARQAIAVEAVDLEKANQAREASLRTEITKASSQLEALRAEASLARDKTNSDAAARRAALELDIKKITAELADIAARQHQDQTERQQVTQQAEKLHDSELATLRERVEAEKKSADAAANVHASADAALLKLFAEKKAALADQAKREEARAVAESEAAAAVNAKLESEKALVEATRQKVAAAEQATAIATQKAEAARTAEKEAKRLADVERAEAASHQSVIATIETAGRNPLLDMKLPLKTASRDAPINWAKAAPVLAAATAFGVLLGTQFPRSSPAPDPSVASAPSVAKQSLVTNAEPVRLRLDTQLRKPPKLKP